MSGTKINGEHWQVNGFNRTGGGTADGRGGFDRRELSAKLEDGTAVDDVFDEVREALETLGYHKKWNDGWQREADGAIVTCGYSYREVRMRRYLPGHGAQGGPQAIHNIRRHGDQGRIEEFVGDPVELWGAWQVQP